MHPLTAAGILRAWERGSVGGPFDRALALLAVAHPSDGWAALSGLSIGERDERLLTLREESLGSRMHAYARCPACSAELTFDLEAANLRATATATEYADGGAVRVDDAFARFRMPTTVDFVDLPSTLDLATVRRFLAQRCVLAAMRGSDPIPPEALPDELIDAVSEEMSGLDPLNDTTLNLACPDCEQRWSASFDIAAFLWEEVTVLARRLLLDVHVLAHSYGWREAEILSMTATRRDAYLQLAQT
jgi:hypothetical protein